jgi:mono/diheme cytochrome c family protein
MSKTIFSLALAAALLLVSLGPALSAGNWRKGKYLYRKNCRTCHHPGGEAKDLSPATYKQAKWAELFKQNKIPCKPKWPKLSDKAIADMYAYLHGHAADSPSPAKCK